MARITVNPVFDIDTGRLLSHDGQYFLPDDEIPIRLDRGAVKQAKTLGQQANATTGELQGRATDEYGAVVPGLERDANNPTGFTPAEKSAQVTQAGEALGGVNAGTAGEAKLAAMRTRNAAGFAPALAEAARARSRAAATQTQQMNQADAELARQKQQAARQQLIGLYGTDTSGMLHSMGQADQDLATQLQAGKQGWLQNTEGLLDTISNMGNAAAGAKKAFG